MVGRSPIGRKLGHCGTRNVPVGDNVNDLAMIRAAGLGIAMGNALPEVKAAADRIAPDAR